MRKQTRDKSRRGVAIELAVILILLVAVFSSVVLLIATRTTAYSTIYGSYTESKLMADAIGDLLLADGYDAAKEYAEAAEWSVVVDESGTTYTYTVSDSAGSVALTVVIEDGTLVQYTYGE